MRDKLLGLATKMVKGLRGLSYEDRLRRENLFSIERRIPRGHLISANNLFQGRLDMLLGEFLKAIVISEGMTGNSVAAAQGEELPSL